MKKDLENLEIIELLFLYENNKDAVDSKKKDYETAKKQLDEEIAKSYGPRRSNDENEYEAYKKGFLSINKDAKALAKVYDSNMAYYKYFAEIKDVLSKKIIEARKDLTERADSLRARVNTLNLTPDYDAKGILLIGDTTVRIKQYREELGSIEKAIEKADDLLENLVLSDDEKAILTTELADEQLKMYDDLYKNGLSTIKSEEPELPEGEKLPEPQTEAVPVEPVPVEPVPVEAVPVEAVPVEPIPVEAVPVEPVPVEPVPVEPVPVEPDPTEAVPAEPVPELDSIPPILDLDVPKDLEDTRSPELPEQIDLGTNSEIYDEIIAGSNGVNSLSLDAISSKAEDRNKRILSSGIAGGDFGRIGAVNLNDESRVASWVLPSGEYVNLKDISKALNEYRKANKGRQFVIAGVRSKITRGTVRKFKRALKKCAMLMLSKAKKEDGKFVSILSGKENSTIPTRDYINVGRIEERNIGRISLDESISKGKYVSKEELLENFEQLFKAKAKDKSWLMELREKLQERKLARAARRNEELDDIDEIDDYEIGGPTL